MADELVYTDNELTEASSSGLDLYYKAESELQNHTLAIYGTEGFDNTYRPTLAGSLKSRFFGRDHATQTEVTEILDVKEMANTIQELMQDIENLRKEIAFTKKFVRAEYDAKLQDKSVELYCRINEKVADLEKMHQDRVNCLRKAYRQQLADAVAKLAVYFNKDLQHKIVREQTKQKSDIASKDEKFKEMQATILRNEGVIQMLKTQLQQVQMNHNSEEEGNDRFMDRRFSMLENSPQVDSLQEELVTVKEELAEVTQKLGKSMERLSGLEDTLKTKVEEIKSLYKETDFLKEQLRKTSNRLGEKLEHEHETEDTKQMLDEQVKWATEEAVKKVKAEAEKTASQDQKKIKQLMNQISELEKQLAKEKDQSITKSQASFSGTVEKLKAESKLTESNEKLKAEIKRLQGELEKSQRSWEKKFAILQQSMLALKEEGYLRQTLQKQAAQIPKATVMYSLQVQNKGQGHIGDYVSNIMPAPSDKRTTMFLHNENQVMEDGELDMITAGIEPLPSPKIRIRHDLNDENQQTSQPRLPVLPRIQAK